MQYKYHIELLAYQNIRAFYRNVFVKYSNTYSYSDMLSYINITVDAIYGSNWGRFHRSTLAVKCVKTPNT